MKNLRLFLLLLVLLIFTKIDPLHAQQSIICDTNAVGSIFLYTIPSRVLVEIPGLEIKGSKTDEAILIERAPAGKGENL